MTKRLVLDIETNTKHDKIWLCVTKDIDTEEIVCHTDETTLKPLLAHCDLLIGHNLISFDAHLLNKCWKTKITTNICRDTLVLSRLLRPDLDGGHSLDAWGKRLNSPKIEFNDYDGGLTPEMQEYCIQDVNLTHKLYLHLTKELEQKGFSERSILLEHDVQAIIAKQERNGWLLDLQHTTTFLASLKDRQEGIKRQLEQRWPTQVIPRFHAKTGKPIKPEVIEFNPGSRQQIAEKLMELGWKPTKKTEKGQIIVDETTLDGVDIPEAKQIAEYLLLGKRISQVQSWLDALKEDGRVHGKVITCGAVTGRMTHHSPNMAQVPNSSAPYGPECRQCWTVEKGYKLVGADASGLELRMLAHYMQDPDYINAVVHGKREDGTDIHTVNQKAAGLQSRDQAKTFIYAFLYGAGPAKIGAIVGGGYEDGQRLQRRFLASVPALDRLRTKVQRIAASGTLPGLDGRRLSVREEHKALNTLLQSAGAIVMKEALVVLDKSLKSAKLDYRFVGNIHDEWQMEVREDQAEQTGILAVEAIRQAGINLGLRCPLDGEYKIGNNWAETH